MKLTLRNTELDITTPVVMGVLNVTPDSFSDGGEFNHPEKAMERIHKMIEQGASIIDIGGESTRPGSEPVSEMEEMARTERIIRNAVKRFPEVIISIDTMKAGVAQAALEAGAHLVNDVSGLQVDAHKAELCAHFGAGLIIMHSKGKPREMQKNPEYEDVVQEVHSFLKNQAEYAASCGVKSIILDPGIGFGKTVAHNLALIANVEIFTQMGYPVLMGASRKSLIGQILNNRGVEGRLAGTIALHYHALMKGSKIIRVHDVREAVDSIRILNAINQH